MAKNTSLQNVQEIVMATSDKNESARRTAMLKEGTLRKIAPKVYTTTMDEAPEVIIKRNLFYVLGQLYPHAVISHRSAYELKPTAEGDIFLTYTYTKNVSLPGVTVHLMQGPMGTSHDMPFIENLYILCWRPGRESNPAWPVWIRNQMVSFPRYTIRRCPSRQRTH